MQINSINQQSNKRIAKNTLLLYFRMLLLMLVSLYTSRVVLQILGVDDFGVYNVVGGIVAMFSIVSQSLSKSISRYITFELGRGGERLNEIFCTSVNIQFLMSAIIFLVGEIGGELFIYNKMNIEPERLFAASLVLQLSLLNFGINLVSVPYNAAIVAHERMGAFAYISIVEAFLKLGSALLLIVIDVDKLVAWAALQTLVALFIRYIYMHYCTRNFEETKYRFMVKKNLFKDLFNFASWNFIGSVAGVLRSQGVNILLNVFCGTGVNAARGLAVQVNNAVSGFANNFMIAINPQITKLYAQNKTVQSFRLGLVGSRLSFYLVLLLSMPIAFQIDYILGLWLTVVPDSLPEFVKLSLLLTLVEVPSLPLITIQLATGNIKKYQMVVGGLHLLNFPVAWVLLDFGFSANSVYWVAIVLAEVCLFARIIMLKQIASEISVKEFVFGVVFKTSIVFVAAFFVAIHIRQIVVHPVLNFIAVAFCTLVVILLLGLNKSEWALVKARFAKR